MTRYSCKSYFDDDAQEQRWAVERQDGNVYRVLQRCFITKEGSQVWLDRYISIKKQKPQSQRTRDAARRANARQHDPRRAATSGMINKNQRSKIYVPPPTPILYRNVSEIISDVWKTLGKQLGILRKDCKTAIPACLGCRGKEGWKQHHLTVGLWYKNPVALDICMSWCCCSCCLINNMHNLITKQKDIDRVPRRKLCNGLLNPGCCCICCCICNRRRVVEHYNLGENYIQTCCLSIFCSCCACCQEMYEVSVREGNLGKPCPCACCCNCVHAGHAKGSRYVHRNTIGSRVGHRNHNRNNVVGFDKGRYVVSAAPQEVVATRMVYNEEYPATNEDKPTKPHYLQGSWRQIGTGDHSIVFHTKLDIGQKKRQIKNGWSLALAPILKREEDDDRREM